MPTIAYFLDVFPVVSETFILHEIIELRKRGLSILIYALQRPERYEYNSAVHSESRALAEETLYLSFHDIRMKRTEKAFLHLSVLIRSPLRYLKVLYYAFHKGGESFFAFKMMPLYLREIRERKVEHIHAHFACSACEYAMLLSRLSGIPFSLSVHAYDIYSEQAREMSGYIRYAEFIVTCTAYNRQYLMQKYGEHIRDKLRLNYHGVYADRVTPSAEPGKMQGTDFNILTVGRLVKKKGFPYLIEALSLLKASAAGPFIVNIIGDGPEKERLFRMVEEYDLRDHVFFRGVLPFEEIRAFYREADIFVLPCIIAENGDRDGIPNVIFEAMSSGLPVISTNISGIPEVITEGVDGFLVDPKDSNTLAYVMKELFQNRDLRVEMGRNARKKVESRFDKKQHIDELLDIFQTALKTGGR